MRASGAMVPPMIDEEDRAGVATLLAWWREMGVDGALDDIGTDWLARDEAVPGQSFALRKAEPPAEAAHPAQGARAAAASIAPRSRA